MYYGAMRSIVMDRIIWTRLLFLYGLFVLYGDMEGKLKRHRFILIAPILEEMALLSCILYTPGCYCYLMFS